MVARQVTWSSALTPRKAPTGLEMLQTEVVWDLGETGKPTLTDIDHTAVKPHQS
jgi:hypothetical protein